MGKYKNAEFEAQQKYYSAATEFVKEHSINADVVQFGEYKTLEEEIPFYKGEIILFSNFPPNHYLGLDSKLMGSDDYYISK
ncbi:MAG: hypothetical protein ACOYNS_17250, partial [Bacteroidota bacterium]